MNTHDHDRDLIMALAEGTLDAPAAARARRSIESCAECAEDLALQESALALFAAAPPVTLTELEAARLGRDLDTALGHDRTAVAAADTSPRRFNWAPVFSIAAVLLALVLVAPQLELLGGGQDDSGSEGVALDAITEDVSAGDGEGGADVQSAEAPSTDELVTQSDRSGDEAAESSPTEAAAAEENATFSAPSDVTEQLLVVLHQTIEPSDDPDDARILAADLGVEPPPLDDDQADCLAEGAEALGLGSDDAYVLGDVDLGDGLLRITVYPQRSSLDLAAHDASSCEPLALFPG